MLWTHLPVANNISIVNSFLHCGCPLKLSVIIISVPNFPFFCGLGDSRTREEITERDKIPSRMDYIHEILCSYPKVLTCWTLAISNCLKGAVSQVAKPCRIFCYFYWFLCTFFPLLNWVGITCGHIPNSSILGEVRTYRKSAVSTPERVGRGVPISCWLVLSMKWVTETVRTLGVHSEFEIYIGSVRSGDQQPNSWPGGKNTLWSRPWSTVRKAKKRAKWGTVGLDCEMGSQATGRTEDSYRTPDYFMEKEGGGWILEAERRQKYS